MPTIAQRCARRLPLGWTVEKTGVVANRMAMRVMRPALGVDGDFIVRRAITPLIALRSVLADTLPARLAFGLIPTLAFDPSTGSVVSALTDGELSTSHAWLNNPTALRLAQSPRKWGVPRCMPAAVPDSRRRDNVGWYRLTRRALQRALKCGALATYSELSLQLFNGFVLRPPADTLFSPAILEWGPNASQHHGVCRAGTALSFSARS
ncbi:hypothetical protein N5B55_06035 [Ralstonia pickettii]|uniref:hypothetical protein n=1 Tax=Ralstonia pickettii TaxID=329 RepID=UPI002715407C|nr:hypothetical protein [Ralstonia pickettii]WKZ86504.1 hypothetical protein N5B55_06035 [Ralstonia pickettii]